MPQDRAEAKKEKVGWELPSELLSNFKQYCSTYALNEEEVAARALERFLAERLLEEGE